MNTSDPDDIILWPDDSFCTREELEEFGRHKSDDYTILLVGTELHSKFCEEYF